jgi:hypothetical protein
MGCGSSYFSNWFGSDDGKITTFATPGLIIHSPTMPAANPLGSA